MGVDVCKCQWDPGSSPLSWERIHGRNKMRVDGEIMLRSVAVDGCQMLRFWFPCLSSSRAQSWSKGCWSSVKNVLVRVTKPCHLYQTSLSSFPEWWSPLYTQKKMTLCQSFRGASIPERGQTGRRLSALWWDAVCCFLSVLFSVLSALPVTHSFTCPEFQISKYTLLSRPKYFPSSGSLSRREKERA